MAKVLRLANISQGVTVDLLAGTLKMQDGTWRTRHTGERAIETLDLVADDTDSNIIAGEAAISAALYEAKRWHRDRLVGGSYWLEANATSENARRSLIYDGLLETETRSLMNPLLGSSGGQSFFRLALTRHPLWENVTASTATTTNVSSVGGKWTIADPTGTADARLAQFDIKGRSGGGILTRAWVGIRPTYYGVTDFTSVWECESGTLGTDTASAADANASGGNVANCTFGTDATLTDRVTLVIGNTTTPEHMVGRYLVLLRCYVDASTVCGVQVRTGFSGISQFAENKEVYNIDNTSAQFIELGEIQIPGQGYRNLQQGTNNVKNFTLKLAAERTSGSGDLYLDAIVLIPSEHMIYLDDVNISYSGAIWPTEVYVNENEEVSSLSYGGATVIPTHAGILGATNWRIPKDGGVLVFAGQGASAQTVADAVDLGTSYHPRWVHWRGT